MEIDSMPSDGKVCSSVGSEIPLWLASCHKRNDEKITSLLSIVRSPLPPFTGSSKSASAKKPLGLGDAGCGVAFPNSSLPPSIVPFPLRSKASQESSEPALVQESLSLIPSLFRSKLTPPAAPVRLNPSPFTSITMGVAPQQQPCP